MIFPFDEQVEAHPVWPRLNCLGKVPGLMATQPRCWKALLAVRAGSGIDWAEMPAARILVKKSDGNILTM